MKRYKIYVVLFFSSLLFFGGCYTQLAVRGYERERAKPYDEDEYQSESYQDADTSYDGYDEEGYYSEEDRPIINNYYFGSVYPSYRRYLWGYYPSISFGITWGSFYDPYYWDPFYSWYWCGTPYYTYYPNYFYYSYYPWYYNPYYYGGYGYRYYYSSPYQRRSDNMSTLRNNEGLRGSLGGRGRPVSIINRGNSDEVSTGRTLRSGGTSREIISDRENDRTGGTVDGRDKTREIDIKRKTVENDGSQIRSSENERSKPVERNTETRIKRNDSKVKKDVRKSSEQQKYKIYQERQKRKSEKENSVKQNNDNNKPRDNSKIERKPVYNPPTRSSNPPSRSFNPPSRESSPPARSNNTTPRNSGSGGGGSDRRTR